MKFGKELSAQMVQEWQGAYMDYNHLKNLLKHIAKSQHRASRARTSFLQKKRSMQRAFSGLTARTHNATENEEAISEGPIEQPGPEDCFRARFSSGSAGQGGELEQAFFEKLDGEFDKVAKFYEAKVGEVRLRAEKVSRQMDALVGLRIKADKPHVEQDQGKVDHMDAN